LAGCGQNQDQGTAGTSAGAATDGAAKPDVGAAANSDVQNCLDLVAKGSYEQAVPICSAALSADLTNDKLKAALETANAKIAETAAQAAQGAADSAAGAAEAAQDAADTAEDAAEQAEDAAPAPAQKTY
jgi:hypothetical protein